MPLEADRQGSAHAARQKPPHMSTPQQQQQQQQQQQLQQQQQQQQQGRALQQSRRGGSIEEIVGGEKPTYLRPLTSEVVTAVGSLYADKLKPFGRILLKRVRECNAAAATAAARAAGDSHTTVDVDSVPLIDPKVLRRICETSDVLRVEPEDGKEYSVLLIGTPKVFVDVCSPVDTYPPELWSEAAEYFEQLQGEDMLLPGGRYACAQVLFNRKLPFLANRSLGEICHIVQLAVSQKRILGYLEGNMVPFGRSVDFVKEQCAVWQQPVSFAKKAAPDMPLATWEEARACLWEILDSAATRGQPGVITLSNVKRLFRSRFSLELSETALGHSRLNELLQDHRFDDICTMELQGKSQVVVQRMPSAALLGESTAIDDNCADFWQTWTWPQPYMAAAEPAFVDASQGLDPNAAPWSPQSCDEYAYLSTMPMTGPSGLEVPQKVTLADMTPADEPQQISAKDMLSTYVQQLLELEERHGSQKLQDVSSHGLQGSSSAGATAAADGATAGAGASAAAAMAPLKVGLTGENSCRSSISGSCSTSDNSNGNRSDDGGESDDSDSGGTTPGIEVRGQDVGALPSLAQPRKVVAPPPGLGLAPPPGL